MNNAYEYYKKVIKPMERKYNIMCNFYHLFKLNYFKKKKDIYNKLLIKYYKVLQNNINEIKEIKKRIC